MMAVHPYVMVARAASCIGYSLIRRPHHCSAYGYPTATFNFAETAASTPADYRHPRDIDRFEHYSMPSARTYIKAISGCA
jgi:hypothetical protein